MRSTKIFHTCDVLTITVHNIYCIHLPSGGLGGVERLYRDVKKDGKYDISRAQLKKWLMKQDTYTLHKPARRHYKRNRVIVGGIDELWQMDLDNKIPTFPSRMSFFPPSHLHHTQNHID